WKGERLPPVPTWPYPFILKASHGCNQYAICHNRSDWDLHDRDWNQLTVLEEADVPPPKNLQSMLHAAELVGRHFDFARVDFYEIDGSPKFGEVTFYPGSGLDPFDPPRWDLELGKQWLAAQSQRAGVAKQAGAILSS
ncbi:MAG: ATP-grasp fold amidoligase family protein, partial [Alteraurantiacibacter sp.]